MQDFIRQDKVNLSQYVPRFILKDETISNILKVESDEHERQRLELIDLLKQFFVSSATWGLEKWENLLGVIPDNGDTIPQRRARIYAKLQGRQISTVAFLERLCKLFMSDSSIVRIVEDNEHYMFRILQENGSILYYDDMIDAINTYKPAHLNFIIILKRLLELKENEKVNVGMINALIKESYINIPPVPDSKGTVKSGVAIGRGGFLTMGIEQPDSMAFKTYFGTYKKRAGKIRIEPFDPYTPPPRKPIPAGRIDSFIATAKLKVGTIHIESENMPKVRKKGNILFNGLASGKGGKVSIDVANVDNAYMGMFTGAAKIKTGTIRIEPLDPYKAPEHKPEIKPPDIKAFSGIGLGITKKVLYDLEHVPKFDSNAYFGTINNKGGIIKIGGSK